MLIPAADNSIAGNAFRPGDVLRSRNGMTVEIGNTDAEGRLVLADALSLADEEAPDYLITIATLTVPRASRSGLTCRRSTPTTTIWRRGCSQAAQASAILSGGCRCGRLTTDCSRAISPT